MKKRYFINGLLYLLVIITLANCKTPYDPPLGNNQTNFLVVEGYIDGAAPTTIHISRTRMLSAGDTAATKKELFARVFVEDDKQNRYPLVEAGEGVYTSNSILNLNPANNYRLYVQTVDNIEYTSTYVPYKQTPVIDSVGWKFKDEGIQFYVNTHDASNKSRYYRWSYHETWEFRSIYNSRLEYNFLTDKVVTRNGQIYNCWGNAYSDRILLASSAKLSDDVIYQAPLVDIENHSKKMSILYSILVTQYTLGAEEYNYWEAMRNNTEKIGSIFDPQPNQTVGNIQCITTPSEKVVGYIGAGSSYSKRYFVYNREMPDGWNLHPSCDQTLVTPDSTKFYFNYAGLIPTASIVLDSGAPAYLGAPPRCVDCTLSGTNVKPDFWP